MREPANPPTRGAAHRPSAAVRPGPALRCGPATRPLITGSVGMFRSFSHKESAEPVQSRDDQAPAGRL